MQHTTWIEQVDQAGIDALRCFAAQLAEATGLRPSVSVDDTAGDVQFAEESGSVVRIDWRMEIGGTDAADWETEANESAVQSPQRTATMVAHYARQMESLAANPQAAQAILTEPGRGRTGTRSPKNQTRRRRRRKEGDS